MVFPTSQRSIRPFPFHLSPFNPLRVLSQVCLLRIRGAVVPLQLLQPLVCRQEVVFKVEVGEVLAVEQVRGQLLQAAAGQIDRIDPLGHHLDEGVPKGRGNKRERETWS